MKVKTRKNLGSILVLLAVCIFGWSLLGQVKQTQKQAPHAPAAFDLPAHTLHIPSLNIVAPLIYTDARSENEFQVALQNGVVHFPGTALPGQNGNAYFFGHSSDHAWAAGDYKTVFANLPQITEEADIYVSNAEETFRYRVKETLVVKPDDLSVLAQTSHAILSLQTSYPVGTAKQRFIVISELVQTAADSL